MTPHLNWEEFPHKIYGNTYCARIFLDYSLNVYHNGDDGEDSFYNVELQDSHGNEIDGICGGETIEEAKQSALDWLIEELKKVTI